MYLYLHKYVVYMNFSFYRLLLFLLLKRHCRDTGQDIFVGDKPQTEFESFACAAECVGTPQCKLSFKLHLFSLNTWGKKGCKRNLAACFYIQFHLF